nr:MAPEG family protein [Polymorphobacter sp.]
MHSPILAPMVALVAWTLVVLVWAVTTRLPALKKVGIDISTVRGSKPGGLDGIIADEAQWKMHNYIHLLEQPVLFYAICTVLAITGTGGGLNAILAWTYVGLRVAHSIVQGTSNIIRYRFALFALSTIALLALTLHAGMALLHG